MTRREYTVRGYKYVFTSQTKEVKATALTPEGAVTAVVDHVAGLTSRAGLNEMVVLARRNIESINLVPVSRGAGWRGSRPGWTATAMAYVIDYVASREANASC